MHSRRHHLSSRRGGILVLLATMLSTITAVALMPSPSFAAATATYSATQTIPVPPASSFAGQGGGDGWALAVGATQVFNVFHHSSSLTVACHEQADASPCWAPETITDTAGNGFATSGHAGLRLDLATGKLYVFGTRTSDSTGGVVCIDTTLAPTNTNPFCGFTALTAVGEAPWTSGLSAISAPALVGEKWYAFNYVQGAEATGTQNKLLCFDLSTHAACASQPYTLAFAAGTNGDTSYPPPGVAAIGSVIVVPVTVGGSQQLACFDTATGGTCSGSWPVALSGYNSQYGTSFPLLSPTGAIIGVCLPTGTDPCFSLAGASVPTPAGMMAAIPSTSGWNGASMVLGPRVYVPNGNGSQVDCYDASTAASCVNFPKTLSNLSLLYTVNADPQRPTCIWVNADTGGSQIQNFDAYTGGQCGEGSIRVLGSSFVVPTQLCQPATYTSLQILSPAPGTYTSGVVSFQDNDANPIPGIPDATVDNTGSVDLTGLNLSTNLGLPQFVITLTGGSSTPAAVTVKLTWTGTDDPSCVGPGVTVSVPPTTLPATTTTLPAPTTTVSMPSTTLPAPATTVKTSNGPAAVPAAAVTAQPTFTG